MKAIIKNYENGETLGEIEVRKNSKMSTIADKVCEHLQKEYNCTIRKRLIQGQIDFATKTQKIHYVLFGENTPCTKINIELEEN